MRRSAPPRRDGRRAVPQSVRPHVGSAGNLTEQAMHDRAYLTRIQSPSPTAWEERRAAQRTDEPGPRAGEPALDGLDRGAPNGTVRLVTLCR